MESSQPPGLVSRVKLDANIHSTGSPAFERKRLSDIIEVPEYVFVTWDEGDPENPHNWSRMKRWYITVLSSILVLNATFASAAPAGVIPSVVEEFGMSSDLGVLTISLFVAGYCVGPLLWAPLSEQWGRKPIFVLSFSVYLLLQIGNALVQNATSLLVLRVFGGIFAAAPLANSGAVISDIWDASTRGKALALFTLAPFAGPALGPTISGFITVTNVPWAWIFGLLAIFAGISLVLVLLTLPETYAPVLLQQKARRLRKKTGDSRYISPIETQLVSTKAKVASALLQPFRILFHEPMLVALTAYMSFLYGTVYLLFQAYPIVFTRGHHFNPGVSGLMLLNLPLGGMIGVALYLGWINPRYEKAIVRCAPLSVPPEIRLEVALIGTPLFALSFFWFGWTTYSTISFVAPLLSGVLMGFAVYLIFIALVNYIVDAYLAVAASALAANTVFRSMAGAAFPMFATHMYESLNPRWASTVLGLVATVMMPLPFVLIRYGPKLRENSRYTPAAPRHEPIQDMPNFPASPDAVKTSFQDNTASTHISLQLPPLAKLPPV